MGKLWMVVVATMLLVASAVPLAQTASGAVGASLDHVSAFAQLPACTVSWPKIIPCLNMKTDTI